MKALVSVVNAAALWATKDTFEPGSGVARGQARSDQSSNGLPSDPAGPWSHILPSFLVRDRRSVKMLW